MVESSRKKSTFLSSIAYRAAMTLVPLASVTVLGAIALCHPTLFWTSFTMSGVILALVAMMVNACFGSLRRRPFRWGFVIAGGSFFALINLFPVWDGQEMLITSHVIEWGYGKLFPNSHASPMPNARFTNPLFNDVPLLIDVPQADSRDNPTAVVPGVQMQMAANPTDGIDQGRNFWMIGNSLWTLICGWIGGIAAQLLARRQAIARQRAAQPDLRATAESSLRGT